MARRHQRLDDQAPPTTMKKGKRGEREWTREEKIRYYNNRIYATLAFLCVWVTGSSVYIFRPFDSFIMTNERHQQWSSMREHVFPGSMFKALKEELVGSRFASATHPLTDVTQGRVTGSVFSFNLAGEEELRSNPDLAQMFIFFDKVRLKGTNAFVLSLMRVTSRGTERADPDLRGRRLLSSWFAAKQPDPSSQEGAHRSMALKTRGLPWSRTTFVAYSTCTLWLQVPRDMTGGSLVLLAERLDGAIVPQVVPPVENSIFSFRGDLRHYVEGFSSHSGQPRVSLVLEQYYIDEDLYGRVQPLWTSVTL